MMVDYFHKEMNIEYGEFNHEDAQIKYAMACIVHIRHGTWPCYEQTSLEIHSRAVIVKAEEQE